MPQEATYYASLRPASWSASWIVPILMISLLLAAWAPYNPTGGPIGVLRSLPWRSKSWNAPKCTRAHRGATEKIHRVPPSAVRADLRFHFCSTVPLIPHPDWPVVCLAIGRTGVPLSVHLYMVMPGRFALVLLEVPLSVHPDWPVGGTSSQRILRSESVQWVKRVVDCHRRYPYFTYNHLFRTFIVHFSDLKR